MESYKKERGEKIKGGGGRKKKEKEKNLIAIAYNIR